MTISYCNMTLEFSLMAFILQYDDRFYGIKIQKNVGYFYPTFYINR